VRITSKGQVTIPQAIRERYGFLPDTDVDFVVSGGRVTIAPRKIQVNDRGAKAVARLTGSATTGMSTDVILALTRG
jgi:AbrB family looped-hinge helix DNA binding protein